jgi:hypothetical protein
MQVRAISVSDSSVSCNKEGQRRSQKRSLNDATAITPRA